jgi:hypothetical protein
MPQCISYLISINRISIKKNYKNQAVTLLINSEDSNISIIFYLNSVIILFWIGPGSGIVFLGSHPNRIYKKALFCGLPTGKFCIPNLSESLKTSGKYFRTLKKCLRTAKYYFRTEIYISET